MIKGIGIDIIELDRIHTKMKKNERLADRILTENEKETFKKLTNERRKIEFLAGRFAAKEAFAKATGKGIGELRFHDIEVRTDKHGAPAVYAEQFNENNMLISITHSRDYAVAQVIIEEIN